MGSYGDKDGSVVKGSVTVFRKVPGQWSRIVRLLGRGGTNGAALGTSVAQDGDRILAGAPKDDATPVDSGAGYAFDVTRPMQTVKVDLRGQSGSTGFYSLNVRPQVVINEVDARTAATDQFVEVLGPPSFSLADYTLCGYNASGTSLGCAALTERTTNAAGYLALYYSQLGSTLNLPKGAAGAVELKYLGVTADRVCWGSTTPILSLCETDRAPIGETRTIGRCAGVDTNRNSLDFVYQFAPTPSTANDRAALSPLVPLGEP